MAKQLVFLSLGVQKYMCVRNVDKGNPEVFLFAWPHLNLLFSEPIFVSLSVYLPVQTQTKCSFCWSLFTVSRQVLRVMQHNLLHPLKSVLTDNIATVLEFVFQFEQFQTQNKAKSVNVLYYW